MKAALVVVALVVASCSGCNQIPVVSTAVVDCADSHAADVSALYAAMRALLTTGGSWADVEHTALVAGEAVGGCALSELVQDYLGGRTAPPKADGLSAHAALDDFRKHFGDNPSFKVNGRLL